MTTQTTARTAGPLSRNIAPARKYATLFAGRNTHVCVLDTVGKSDAEIEANADFIVRAWNAHDDLVTALRRFCGDNLDERSEPAYRAESMRIARAALAKAGAL